MRLVILDLALLDAAVESDETLGRALGGYDVVAGWSGFPEAVRETRERLAEDPARARWGQRGFVLDAEREMVGWGGFTGPPQDGTVEIGYAIAPGRQGRGLATAAALELLREAYLEPGVRSVIAHTLPERNASVRVLEKLGFQRDGTGEDADEGTVWRFRHRRDG